MKTIRYIHSLMATVLICFSSQFTIAQTIPSPVIDSVLTVDHDFFFNGEIIVPYSTGHVSVTNNANIQIHSTIDVDLLPGFTASVDSGCGEFVAGIRGCPYVEASKVISNVSCYGQNDGSVDISIGNTTNQYKYLWSVGGDTKHIKKNLSAGTYLITIVDSTACNILDSVTISQPDSIISYISTSLATCGDSTGTASVHITGGKNPFTYYWYPYGGSDSIVSNLISGNYELIIRDSNFCSQKYYFEIGDSNGAEIHVDSIRNATCSSFPDGAIFTHYSGGTPPLNCIWQGSNDTGSVILNLSSGTYKLLVQDSLGCKNYKSVQVSEPDPIVISFFNNSTICNQNTGSAYAIVSGGVTPYSYLWTSGSTDSVANQLGNGIQRILVTDHNGCTSTDSTSIESGGGPQIVINNIKNVTCFDGSDGKASVEVLSGNAPFTYLWLPDSTTTDTIDNIKAGNHMVIVKDVNGCETSSIVNIIDPPKIKITILYDPPSNDSTSDGNLYSTVSGGEQDYTYQWSLNNLNTADINQISSGPYSLFITDAKGCQAIERVQVRANI
ncbi:MAG TPA: SprB repeat-containing protein, partial [Bacteroidia bacterium]|nr:SprB repeat-containing protein [Bacteroidia bacterium]